MRQDEFIVDPLGISMQRLSHKVSGHISMIGAPVRAWYVPSPLGRARGRLITRSSLPKCHRWQVPAGAVELGVYDLPIDARGLVEDVYHAAGLPMPAELPVARKVKVMRDDVPLWIHRAAMGMQRRFGRIQAMNVYADPVHEQLLFRNAQLRRYQHSVPEECILVGTFRRGATKAELIDKVCEALDARGQP